MATQGCSEALMTTLQLLSTLPALLGFTGLVIFYFFQRNRGGDQVTLNIVSKLRVQAPGRLPENAEKLDAASLSKLIEGDTNLRSRIDDQDFQLLRDALRQQFITSLVVYGASGLIFIIGIALYVYVNPPAKPVSLSNFTVESANPEAKGLAVDLDELVVRWTATGDPEDIDISLQELGRNRQTESKKVRSTEGRATFEAAEYRPVLSSRAHNGQNRIRVIAQAQRGSFVSPEFPVRVGTKIMVVRFDDKRLKMMGTIDNVAIDFYNFEATLAVQRKGSLEPVVFGGRIEYGKNDFAIDGASELDWGSRKLVYFGPDDPRVVRAEFLGF
jgi:hypothetical protein